MTDQPKTSVELDDARDRYHEALLAVHSAVIAACPRGSDHHVIQHRDGKPPWCPHCGRNSTGTQIKETPTNDADAEDYTARHSKEATQ